jgi:hypothetical protein
MENVQWEIYKLMFGLCGIVVNNGHNRKETMIKNKK